MHKEVELIIERKGGERQRRIFRVEKVYCAGYTGRDQEAVKLHIEELRHMGVQPPPSIPTYFLVSPQMLLVDEGDVVIDVKGDETSAEVEYVSFVLDDIYITVGSDHTDRWLEKIDIARSKQICPKIASNTVWPYSEIRERWDDIRIRCWAKSRGGRVLYQEGRLGDIMPPEELISRFGVSEGSVLFSGTIPTIGGKIVYADEYEVTMIDEHLDRKISVRYSVRKLVP